MIDAIEVVLDALVWLVDAFLDVAAWLIRQTFWVVIWNIPNFIVYRVWGWDKYVEVGLYELLISLFLLVAIWAFGRKRSRR